MKKSKSPKTTDGKPSAAEKEIPDDLSGKPDLPEDFLIVGIGASAGGIQALQEFFEHVPADSGMAYVVILHLSPDHDSRLAEILQSVAVIPVKQVTEKVRVEPNCVYVVPPNQHLEMSDGHIVVTTNTSVEERRAPVDIFFRTLAESHHARAVAVILSGTGANGSMGIKRVKERGGAAFVQNPREAEFSEMPRNSIATDLIDQILNVAEIPARIIGYKESLGKVEIEVEPKVRPEDQQYALREIFTTLRLRTGHDFSNYKRPTILRRIERRINVFNLPDLTAYAAFVRDNRDEATALLKDLLISVTNFFRDRQPFEYLETEILPKIFHGKKPEDQVRIWVAGCATGEEAYSLAILCAERTLGAFEAPAVQIFASDIDEQAIATAREGFYTLNDAADVSPERLRRFFTKEGDGYRVQRELREMILFANHNVIKDPPFSKLDLATCRNLLIYLNQTAQERVMETFHFALNPGGFLFLGNSESVDGAGDLYATVSKENHVFQSRVASGRVFYPVPDAASGGFQNRESVVALAVTSTPLAKSENEKSGANALSQRQSFGDLHQQLLEQYAPPSIVVNEDYDILHLSENAGRFLQIVGGEPTKNLLKLIRPELRLELRAGLYQAVQNQTSVEIKNLKINAGAGDERINIYARPVLQHSEDTARGFILVLFKTLREGDDFQIDAIMPSEELNTSQEPLARQLEEELVRTKSQLRGTFEQFEIQAEELKASNEELQAMNEELRSAAEELETGKEELQSVNEELITVNQELKVKLEELSLSNNDFQNLINSTDTATIFLDRSFRVHTFTPAATRIFNLIAADVGRPLTDITHRIETGELLSDAEKVLDSLQTVEREIHTTDGLTYLMRVLPYRTAEDRINGIVATFLDITERKRAEEFIRVSEERLKRAINIETVGVIFFNNKLEITDCNDAFVRMSGYQRDELRTGKFSWSEFTPDEFIESSNRAIEELNANGISTPYEKEYIRKDGTRFWAMFAAKRISENEIVEFVTDITEQKRAEELVRESEARQAYLLKLSDAIRPLSEIAEITETVTRTAMDYFKADRCCYGEVEGDVVTIRRDARRKGLSSMASVYSLDELPLFTSASQNAQPIVVRDVRTSDTMDESLKQFCLSLKIVAYINVPITKDKRLVGYFCLTQSVARDWTEVEIKFVKETAERTWSAVERARAEAALRESENLFRFVSDAVPAVIYDWNVQEDSITRSGELKNLLGYSPDDPKTQTNKWWKTRLHPDDAKPAIETVVEKLKSRDYRFEDSYRLQHRDGHYVWVSDTGVLLRDEAGKVTRWVGSATNITERKEAEAALRESEEQYRTLFNSIDEGFCTIEVLFDEGDKPFDYRLLETNPAFERQTGLVDVMGKTMLEIAPDMEEFWFEIYGEVASTGEPQRFEHRAEALGRFYDVYAFRIGEPAENRVAIIFNDITERHRIEQIVRESEERLRLATEASEMATWEWNLLTDEVFWNKRHFTLFGMKPRKNPLDADVFFKHVHPDDRTRVGDALKKAVAEKSVFDTDFRAVLDNHDVRWMSGYGRVVEEATDGAPVRMSGVMFDITERKESEQALQESEIRYRAIVGQSTAGITELDLKGYHAFANLGYCETLGYTEAELLKLNICDITHPDDYAHCLELFKDTIKTGTPHITEKRIVRKNGNIVWITESISLITDANGNPLRVATIAIDITNRRRAEEALRESDTRLRLLIESASDHAIFTTTIDGLIDSWNAGAEKVFGWTEAEVLGKPNAIIFTPEDLKKSIDKKEMKTALRSGRAPDERFHIRKDGSRFYVSGVTTVLKNEGGAVQGFVKIARDMTEQIEAENSLREKEMLQKLVGAQENERKRIARDLHDELGQLLIGLRMKLESVRKLCDDDQELCDTIGETQIIAKQLDAGIDFLAWELRPAALDDFGLRAALVKYIKEWSRYSGINSEFLSSAAKLERLSPEVEINLYRIAQEALNNVHKHAKAKTVEVSLEKRGKDLIVLIIADNGKGFNVKSKINRTRGIGLIGMHERAVLVGGTLEIESAVGKGTTVFIRVPTNVSKKEK